MRESPKHVGGFIFAKFSCCLRKPTIALDKVPVRFRCITFLATHLQDFLGCTLAKNMTGMVRRKVFTDEHFSRNVTVKKGDAPPGARKKRAVSLAENIKLQQRTVVVSFFDEGVE